MALKCYTCPRCFIKQNRLYNHRRHVLKCYEKTSHKLCIFCQKTSTAVYQNVCINCAKGYVKCQNCIFVNSSNIPTKLSHMCRNQYGHGRANSAFKDTVLKQEIKPKPEYNSDALIFFASVKDQVIKHITDRLNNLKGVKTYFTLHVHFIKFSPEGEAKKTNTYFRTKTKIILNLTDIDNLVCELYSDLYERIQNFCRLGSGWLFEKIQSMHIDTVQYLPLSGGKYNNLPFKLRKSRYLINMENTYDNSCFELALLALLYPVKTNKSYASSYREHYDKINMNGISKPVSLKDIPTIEKLNNININVFAFEDTLYPIYLSKLSSVKTVNLLLYNKHYYPITNIHIFITSLSSDRTSNRRRYYCLNCFQYFYDRDKLQVHSELCGKFDMQVLKLPSESEKILKFDNFHKSLQCPVVFYCDFESYLRPKNDEKIINVHEVNSYAMLIVWRYFDIKPKLITYMGENAIEHFMNTLYAEYEIIHELLSDKKPIEKLSSEQRQSIMNQKSCHICGKDFKPHEERCLDHCPATSKVRGMAHLLCNFRYTYRKQCKKFYVPILFHNNSRYDMHLLISNMTSNADRKISCIPESSEKYKALFVDNFAFIDTYNFLPFSLQHLANVLEPDKFHMMKEIFGENYKLLTGKSIYPYTMANEELMTWKSLPPRSYFHNDLTNENVTEQEYKNAQLIWDKMQIKTFEEYHMLYLKIDTVLLGAIFEDFCNKCLQIF